MKTFHLLLGGFLLAGSAATAQTTDSTKSKTGKISLTIVREENGKKTVIDTSFNLSDENQYKAFLDQNHIKIEKDVPGNSGQRIMKFRYDMPDKRDEKEIVIEMPASPGDPPMAPLPPMPPMPPMDRMEIESENGDVQVYTYRIDDDKMDKDIEALVKIMSEDGDRMKIKKEIRRIEMRSDEPKKRSKQKKSKRKIIIIEEA